MVEQQGKEKVIAMNSPDITFISYDFHEYCRGMRSKNVAILIESLNEIIKKMRHCWVDEQGVICRQNGVFRVNCIDCLDRTNVVQVSLFIFIFSTYRYIILQIAIKSNIA